MKLEQQCCSLKLAQKLKELGVEQESLFIWSTHTEPPTLWWEPALNEKAGYTKDSLSSAFTIAELGEMLPWEVGGKILTVGKNVSGGWVVYYRTNVLGAAVADSRILDQVGDTEADARAKMFIFLLENKLI